MSSIRAFGGKLMGLIKSHPVLSLLFFILFSAFLAGFGVKAYNAVRSKVPGGDKLPAPKVAA